MSLETSKKVLKITGIISILGAIVVILLAVLALIGGGAAANDPNLANDTELQQNVGLAFVGGGILIFTGILSFIDGFVSVKAANTGKKGFATAALVFSAISSVNGITNLFRGGDASNIVGSVVSVALSILACYAAYIVRKNAEA